MSTESAAVSAIAEALSTLQLVDHHVHSVTVGDLERTAFETFVTEAPSGIPAPATQFDSQVGFAIRRWCAPVLDLEPFAPPEAYLERRRALGPDEVNRRLLRASSVSDYLVDTGFHADLLADDEELAQLSLGRVHEIVRLEHIAEVLAAEGGTDAAGFPSAFRERLAEATRHAVGVKSIVAYRYGFHFDPRRPADADVSAAAGPWLDAVSAGRLRLDDPVLLRFLLWSAVDAGLPIQLHTGYGDPDLDLRMTDPLLLKQFLELTLAESPSPTPIVLLHSYPFHRHCGFLAQVYPHVWFDVGLAINYVGARASAVVAESMELAPFSRILFSSDAWGPAELHHLGAHLWRRATADVLGSFVDRDEWHSAEAVRVASMIGRDNALALYRIEARS